MPSYTTTYAPRAERQLAALERPIARRIVARIDALAVDPRPPGCRRLVGDDTLWRIRVGDYRVIYTIQDAELVVLIAEIAHRREVYRR